MQELLLPRLPVVARKPLVVAFFAFVSLKSRVFSLFLDNSRPSRATEQKAREERKRPSWMPPPAVFPIVWSTIAVLRTVSSTMIWEAAGRNLLAGPILALMLHL